MPTPLSQTDICNVALLKLGMNPIQSITDLNSSAAIALNTAWEISIREVMREHPWNCLKTRTALSEVAIPGSGITTTTTPISWAPNTAFTANQVLTYGTGYYSYYIDTTSAAAWETDFYGGKLYQTDITDTEDSFDDTGDVPLYEWDHSYQLPADFILLVELNGTSTLSKATQGSQYEINGSLLYSDDDYADIKYVQYTSDVTRLDPLFINALSYVLAANVATTLKKDNGQTAAALRQFYSNDVLPKAKYKDGGEGKPVRYNPIYDSTFIKARYTSTNR